MAEEYFAATAGVVAVLSLMSLIAGFAPSAFMLWLSAGIASAVCVVVAIVPGTASDRMRLIVGTISQCVLACFCGCVLIAGHRLYIIPVALAQAMLVERYLRSFILDDARTRYAAAALGSLLTWACAVGLVWSPLNEWLMSGSLVTGLSAITFGTVFVLVLGQTLAATTVETGRFSIASLQRRIVETALAVFVFFELAFRTDHFTFDWIPYHRSYWASPADFLRAGHWLLWDVPTQYGFLSELAVAITPGRNAWQSLYVLTGSVLVFEAILLYAVLRRNGGRFVNYLFAVALPCAVLFSSEATRFPFGARLYPQQGLRFMWPMLALFALYMRYRQRDRSEIARRWFIVGWIAWALGLAWSFETGVWTTLIWGGYLVIEQAMHLIQVVTLHRFIFRESAVKNAFASCLVTRILPCLLVPLGFIGLIDGYYHAMLGHFPDWLSFIEFSGIYANADVQPPPLKLLGPGLLVVMLLASVATYGIVFAARKRFGALPLIAAVFAAVWGTSIYYAGEPFDQHVNALLEVFVLAFAVLFAVEREERIVSGSLILARVAIVPMFVLVIATAFGEPGRIARISAPFMPGFLFDGTRDLPPIHGELADLLRRAGVGPNDPVNFPHRLAWIKLDSLIMPFSRDGDGSLREYPTWLPMSPVGPWNTLYTLPPARRRLYIQRFLALDRHRGGWLIMYQEPADCTEISPTLRNVRTVRSKNFSATLCDFL